MSAVPIIVYDLDGTLAWTEKYWLPVMREVVDHLNRQYNWRPNFQDITEILQHLGKPAAEIMRYIYPQASEQNIEEILALKEGLWKELLHNHPFVLYPQTLSTLKAVQDKGIRQLVASNCDEVYLERMLTSTGIGPYIEKATCLGEHPGKSKSEFTAWMLRQISFEQGLFVGDSFHDMEAGRSNGLQTAFANYGYGQSKPELIDFELNDIADLLPLLDRVFP